MQYDEFFKDKKPVPEELLRFGFKSRGGSYNFTSKLDCGLEISVTVNGENASATVYDPETGDPYALHLVPEATGGFVGQVREEYVEILTKIAEKCFESSVFKENQTERLIGFVKDGYGDELEFLWGDKVEGGVWRRKDSRKWYGLIMTADGEKFGRKGKAEIIDLRIKPEELNKIADGKLYFRGYHMNKKSWLTIILDGSVPTPEICRRIEESYALAKK